MRAKTLIPIIFISLLVLIFFGKFLPGCVSGCKAKINNEERTEQPADENGNPTTVPGKAKAAPLVPEATFVVTCADADGNVTATSPCSTTNGRWVGEVCDYGSITADSGMVIIVTLPGYYLNNKEWHPAKNVTLRGGQSNPPLSPRGRGALIITAGR